MSEAMVLHLIEGEQWRGRPTLAAMLEQAKELVGGQIVCLGTGAGQHELVVPHSPKRSVAHAAHAVAALVDRDKIGLCIAWDAQSAEVLTASGRRGMAVLDEHVAPHSQVPACGGLLSGAPDGSGVLQCLPPWCPVPNEPLREERCVYVLAEPSTGSGVMSTEWVLGRWHLLCDLPPVVLAGRTDDQQRLATVQQRVGVQDLRMATIKDAWNFIGPSSVVLMAGGGQEPIAPSVRAWAAGATVVLPEAHRAVSVLGDRDGVIIDVDRMSDATVRAIRGDRTGDISQRSDTMTQWNDQWVDAFVSACQQNYQTQGQRSNTATEAPVLTATVQ